MLESGVVSLLGCLAGLALVTLIAAFAGDALLAFGLARLPLAVNVVEMQLLAAVLVCGLLVGLMPAWRAYRQSLADGLSIRL